MAANQARRGDIWLVDVGRPIRREQSGRRPAVETCPRTSRSTQPQGSARRRSCEDVTSISTDRLVHRIGGVDVVEIGRIARILSRLLAL